MRYALLAVAVLISLAAQQTPFPSGPTLPFPPCDPSDPCPDPTRPWMRGSVEIMCARPDKVDQKRAEHPGKNIAPCELCQHRCDALDERASETDNRAWDNRCSARCSPKGCSCSNPCDS